MSVVGQISREGYGISIWLGQGLVDVRAYIINFFFEIFCIIFQQLRIVHKCDCGKYYTKYIFCMYYIK